MVIDQPSRATIVIYALLYVTVTESEVKHGLLKEPLR